MVPFAGYKMPLIYSDLTHIQSHHWTRENASLFDVSHMLQHYLSGPLATDFLMKITPSSLHTLPRNHSTLSCLLHPITGGIIDDTVITRLSPDSFYFVTNAGRRTEDLAYLTTEINAFKSLHGNDCLEWSLLSPSRALIALQGPKAAESLQPLISPVQPDPTFISDLRTLYFGQSRSLTLTLPDDTTTPTPPLLISRTGYTGEDGFEISIPLTDEPSLVTRITTTLLSTSNGETVKLAGLAARDSLRLEAGMCLYGNDISEHTTPPTASLSWLIGKDRRDPTSPLSRFNGSDVILPQLAQPAKFLSDRRVLLLVDEGAAARAGAELVSLDGSAAEKVGVVTSGLPSPSLGGRNIAMGYVRQGLHRKGTEVGVKVRGKVRKGVVTGPFVQGKYYRG